MERRGEEALASNVFVLAHKPDPTQPRDDSWSLRTFG